jgi:hypothetical protein
MARGVVPVSYTLRKQGRLVEETKSIVTVALKKGAAGWYVAGWAWADG